MSVTSFIRPILKNNFLVYSPSIEWDGRSLKLDSGENMWTPDLSIDWNDVISNSACYPDSSATKLRMALAKEVSLTKEWVAVGNGSDELIDLCCRLFLDSGDRLVDCSPTFPMFSFFGKLSGAEVVDVPRLPSFQLDTKTLKKALIGSKLAFLANPNNPTGTVLPREVLIDILKLGTPIVVDEAYMEFCGETVVDLVKRFENLIVLRTFSKWAGIAGLRIGWIVASPFVIEKILAMKAPYSVNSVAQSVALTILKRKTDFLPALQELIESRDTFIQAVNLIPGFQAIDSRASCVCVRSQKFSMKNVAQALQANEILVKILPEAILSNTLRISIAPTQEMKRVVSVLQIFSKENI